MGPVSMHQDAIANGQWDYFLLGDPYVGGGLRFFFCDLVSQRSRRTLYGFLYACRPSWCGEPLQYGGCRQWELLDLASFNIFIRSYIALSGPGRRNRQLQINNLAQELPRAQVHWRHIET